MPRPVDSATTFSLARFVEDVRVLVPVPGRAGRIEHLPDGRTNLYVRVFEGGHTGDVTLAGPRTRAVFKDSAGVAQVVGLRFKPGWSAPLFGVHTSALTDRYVKLEDLWGRAGAELGRELLATRSVPDVLARLARAISVQAERRDEPASASLARRAVRLLEAGETRVEQVAVRLGVTARHLRRVFTESVGIGPKEFARTVRLQRALRLAATSRDWARIAASAGYYDQAHLIADFRDLVGLTPGAFLAQRASDRSDAEDREHVRPPTGRGVRADMSLRTASLTAPR